MFNIFSLDEHLGTNEKILLFFRPSRKAYILQYTLWIILLFLSIFFSFYGDPTSNLFILWKFINMFSELMIIICIILLIRLEYRIWSRKYAITSEKVIYVNGIFSEQYKSAPYRYITDIKFERSFWDKIINTGTIYIDNAGEDDSEIRYREVNDPLLVKRMITDLQSGINKDFNSQQPAVTKYSKRAS